MKNVTIAWLCSSNVMNMKKIREKEEIEKIVISFPIYFYEDRCMRGDKLEKIEITGSGFLLFSNYEEGKVIEFDIYAHSKDSHIQKKINNYNKAFYFVFNNKTYKIKKGQSKKLSYSKNGKKIKIVLKF